MTANLDELESVAIIGMECRFPGAKNIDALWKNICDKMESITFFKNDELHRSIASRIFNDKNYIKARGVIHDIESFDAFFFKCSAREAEVMDPQTRVFLELAWESLEKAGYIPGTSDKKIGIFAGKGYNTYYANNIFGNPDIDENFGAFEAQLLNEKDFFATQISYKLDLTGPSINVNTGCSTSLVAVCLAFDSLLNYQCDIALAGGVTIFSPQNTGYLYQEGKIASSDGHCRPFDAQASGTVFSNGGGIVVLKRLSEARSEGDTVYAVIKGCGLNNDGSKKMSFTAPSVDGQAEAILTALANAGIDAGDISYIEAHGTATPLGDPVEIEALTQAFRSQTFKKHFCAVGSIKGNIGHLDSAAGVAGIIKTALALYNKKLPPSINYATPNPKINFHESPFYVNTELRDWITSGPRRAGVSSLGIGGTNAHVVLEEAPPAPEPAKHIRSHNLLSFSAKTESALKTTIENMAGFLERNPGINLADVAYTLHVGRKAFPYRATAVCGTTAADAASVLRSSTSSRITTSICHMEHPEIVFIFSGQGSQYASMGRDLYRDEPVFREHVDFCSEFLKSEISVDLRTLLYPAEDRIVHANEQLTQTSLTQPALFVIEYACAQLWISWGVRPQALVGHSIGEYTAACLADVFTVEDALRLVAARGRMMQEMPAGSMLAVFLPEEQLAPFLNDNISVSVINGPTITVVSGEPPAIDELEQSFSDKKIMCRKLHTSHAFHSKMMDPILAPFTEVVKKTCLKPPKIPFLSNVTGKWIEPTEATDPHYWARHLRSTVRFGDCLSELFRTPEKILIEVGPGATLSSLANQHPAKGKNHIILNSLRHPKEEMSDTQFILTTLGALWREGVPINWKGFYGGSRRLRVPLPTYPFERKRYWINESCITPGINPSSHAHGVSSTESVAANAGKNNEARQKGSPADGQPSPKKAFTREDTEKILTGIWRDLLGHSTITPDDNFFTLGGHSLVALRLFSKIEATFGKRIPMATLFSAPTVRQLATLLTDNDLAPSWTSLVKISEKGEKPPFFLIHSEGGNVLEYFKLVSYLKHDRPFYGIQARGLDGAGIVTLTIEEMAKYYLDDIKRVQPQGPYHIGGYCLGGLIAFEMARQIEAAGEAISLLVMISTNHPGYFKKKVPGISPAQRLCYKILERFELEFDNLSVLDSKAKLLYLGDRIRQVRLVCRVKYEEFAEKIFWNGHSKRYSHSRRYNLEKTRAAQSVAFNNYKPSPIKTGITLFRVSRRPRSLIFDPTLGWANYSEGGIRDFEIRAFHKNILKEPNVKTLAAKLQEILNDPKLA